jgi:hypothetical protein
VILHGTRREGQSIGDRLVPRPSAMIARIARSGSDRASSRCRRVPGYVGPGLMPRVLIGAAAGSPIRGARRGGLREAGAVVRGVTCGLSGRLRSGGHLGRAGSSGSHDHGLGGASPFPPPPPPGVVDGVDVGHADVECHADGVWVNGGRRITCSSACTPPIRTYRCPEPSCSSALVNRSVICPRRDSR